MNEFQSTESGAANLKDSYGPERTALSEALKRKRKKLAESKGIGEKEDDDGRDE